MKIAVAGAGVMGRNHIRVCCELDGLDVVGVVEPNAEAAARVARLFHVRTFDTVSHLLAEAKPDILIISTPTSTHFAVAREAIAAGVHLLIEKPIAATVAEGRELVAAAARAGINLGVGHIERFNPAIRELKKHLDAGELGRVYQIVARRLGPFPPRIHDVGVVVDLATHDVNIMEHAVGSPIERVFAETDRRIHQTHEDLVSCALRFASGTVGVIDINWLTPTKIRELSVLGERGMFVVNYLTQDLTLYENTSSAGTDDVFAVMGVSEGRMIRFPVQKFEPLKAEIQAFVAAVRDGGKPLVDGDEGVRALYLARLIARSGREKTALTANLSEDSAT
jgi:UDP-N-acetylglucosamine 3-dehydrogenase